MAAVLKINQTNQRGGARPGAGRPKGSSQKPKLSDDLTDAQKLELLTTAFKKAQEGDGKLLQFFLEQIYGKARQNIGIDGGEEGTAIQILFDEAFKNYDATSSTSQNSSKPKEV